MTEIPAPVTKAVKIAGLRQRLHLLETDPEEQVRRVGLCVDPPSQYEHSFLRQTEEDLRQICEAEGTRLCAWRIEGPAKPGVEPPKVFPRMPHDYVPSKDCPIGYGLALRLGTLALGKANLAVALGMPPPNLSRELRKIFRFERGLVPQDKVRPFPAQNVLALARASGMTPYQIRPGRYRRNWRLDQ